MTRGDIVTVALPGDLGKPRPALIVQSDLFPLTTGVVLLPITSTVIDSMLRVAVMPSKGNGLRTISQIMTDRPTTANRQRVGQVIGRLEEDYLLETIKRLSLFLDIA